jgi:hypothetical protein
MAGDIGSMKQWIPEFALRVWRSYGTRYVCLGFLIYFASLNNFLHDE